MWLVDMSKTTLVSSLSTIETIVMKSSKETAKITQKRYLTPWQRRAERNLAKIDFQVSMSHHLSIWKASMSLCTCQTHKKFKVWWARPNWLDTKRQLKHRTIYLAKRITQHFRRWTVAPATKSFGRRRKTNHANRWINRSCLRRNQ